MVFWFVTSCAHVGVYTYTNVSEENIASIFRVLDIICSSGTWYIPTSPHNFTTQKTNISVFTFVDCTRASFGGHRRRDCPWLNPSSQGFATRSSGQKRYSDCERYSLFPFILHSIALYKFCSSGNRSIFTLKQLISKYIFHMDTFICSKILYHLKRQNILRYIINILCRWMSLKLTCGSLAVRWDFILHSFKCPTCFSNQ
jgi:hypothetical protein